MTKKEYPQQQTYLPGRPILTYLRRLFVVLDQLLNAVTGGSPDETVSSRIDKDTEKGRLVPCILCVLLGWIDPDHCAKARERDEGKISGLPTPKLTVGRYIQNVGIALSQLLNVIFGGDEDERLSSRAGKDARRGRKLACIFCRFLDLFDPDHCEKAIERDEGKRPGQYDPPRQNRS
jgi:hypothetical protein